MKSVTLTTCILVCGLLPAIDCQRAARSGERRARQQGTVWASKPNHGTSRSSRENLTGLLIAYFQSLKSANQNEDRRGLTVSKDELQSAAAKNQKAREQLLDSKNLHDIQLNHQVDTGNKFGKRLEVIWYRCLRKD